MTVQNINFYCVNQTKSPDTPYQRKQLVCSINILNFIYKPVSLLDLDLINYKVSFLKSLKLTKYVDVISFVFG